MHPIEVTGNVELDTSGIYSYRINLEDRIKELQAHNIEHILYEIFEKNADGEWEKKQVLVQSRNNDHQYHDKISQDKADQYKGIGRVVALCGSVFFGMGQAYFSVPGGSGLTSALFAGGAKACETLNSVYFDDRRQVRITLLDNQYQRIGSIVGERSQDVQKADYQRHLDQFGRTAENAHRSVQAIFA